MIENASWTSKKIDVGGRRAGLLKGFAAPRGPPLPEPASCVDRAARGCRSQSRCARTLIGKRAELPRDLGRAQDDRGCAVAHGRAVEQVDRVGDHARLVEHRLRQFVVHHRIRIVHRVVVRVDGEGRKVAVRHLVFVHVALHQLRVDGDEGVAHRRFPIGVRRADQSRRDFFAGMIRHLLDAAHQREVDLPAGDGQIRFAKRRTARRARGFDL